jgi:hypothetical protein
MTSRPSARFLSLAVLCLALAVCLDQSVERSEKPGPKVHRLTVDLADGEPAGSRLAKAATAICPAGYDRQEDEPMPPDSPRYRV